MEKLINELEEKGIDYTAEITNFQGVLIYINEDISIQEWGEGYSIQIYGKNGLRGNVFIECLNETDVIKEIEKALKIKEEYEHEKK